MGAVLSSDAMAISIAYWVMSLGCWVYALKFGSWESRWAFALFVLAMVGSWVATPDIEAWHGLNSELLLVDSGYFLGLYALALRSRRYWPIWATGLQLMCMLTHFGPLIDRYSDPKVYRGLESVWMMPMLIIMVVGIARDRRFGRRTRVARHEGNASGAA